MNNVEIDDYLFVVEFKKKCSREKYKRRRNL